MPIEIQTSQGVTPNGLVTFTFNKPVVQYAIGMRAFWFTYGSDDHWIKSLAIRILPVQSASVGAVATQVTAHVRMEMQDSSGNHLNVANSQVWPVCIALTGSPEPNTQFGAAVGVSAGGNGQTVPMPPLGGGYSISTCFQSGFNLAYTPGDHQILQANASCGLQAGQIMVSAGMNDASGNSVQVATVDSGYIASSYPSPGVVAVPIQKQSADPVQVNIPGAKNAVGLITDWNVEYSGVHNLQILRVGSFGEPSCADGVVTLKSCYAAMNDTSGNSQVDNSSCSMIVLATI